MHFKRFWISSEAIPLPDLQAFLRASSRIDRKKTLHISKLPLALKGQATAEVISKQPKIWI